MNKIEKKLKKLFNAKIMNEMLRNIVPYFGLFQPDEQLFEATALSDQITTIFIELLQDVSNDSFKKPKKVKGVDKKFKGF